MTPLDINLPILTAHWLLNKLNFRKKGQAVNDVEMRWAKNIWLLATTDGNLQIKIFSI